MKIYRTKVKYIKATQIGIKLKEELQDEGYTFVKLGDYLVNGDGVMKLIPKDVFERMYEEDK